MANEILSGQAIFSDLKGIPGSISSSIENIFSED